MEGCSVLVGVNPDTLVTFLSRGQADQQGSTLVVDTRPFMSFNAGHIVDAVNVHCPPILKRRSGGFVSLENIVVDQERRMRLRSGGYYSRVVVYDQSTEHSPSAADKESNLHAVVKSLAQQVPGLDRIFYLQGGYDAFSQDCPMLCVTQQFSPLYSAAAGRPLEAPPSQVAAEMDMDDQPVEILPHLFLGSGRHSSRREALQRLGVTALLNVSVTCPDHFPGAFRYLRVPVRDNASEDLAPWFPLANRFIDEVKAEGGKVLVHCQAGRSRSATVCLAYLISTLRLSLDQAFEHVRARRQVIDPNLNFMRQLQDYSLRLSAVEHQCPVDGSSSSSSCPSLVPSGLPSSQSSDSLSRLPPGTVSFTSSSSFGKCRSSGSSCPPALNLWGPCAIPSLSERTPTEEAQAPISLPSSLRASSSSGIPPVFSTADPHPPPSPATANDVHCFFVFPSPESSGSEASSNNGELRLLARTPEILLPS